MNAERWPVDVAALRRGSVLTADFVEKRLGVKRTDPDYWKELLKLKGFIVDYFEESGDLGVVVTARDNGLQILTDEEAAVYVQKRAAKSRKDFAWAVFKGGLVDRMKLSAETRDSLDRWLLRESFRLQQMKKRPVPRLME